MENLILVGEVLKAQGIRGEVKLKSYTDKPADLARIKELYMDEKPVKVLAARETGGYVFAMLEGVADRNAAEALRGKKLFVRREYMPLEEGRYYVADVIGCRLYDDEQTYIGEVTDVISAKTDVFSVKCDEDEIMFPLVADLKIDFDLQNKKITVDKKRFSQISVKQ